MKDRELLELAAKAAGIDCIWEGDGDFINQEDRLPWNPLTDDGDALRLAVKLGLKIEHYSVTSEGRCRVGAGTGFPTVTYEGDAYAATRRCITIAAAQIGKDIKP
jgi:hypothetical protein